jgi:hypothetical protein
VTSAQKVLEVERQVRAMVAGEQEPILTCPFCTMVSAQGQFLCCPEAAEVIGLVLDHMEHIERVDMIDKTLDRLASMTAKSLVSLN